MKQYHSRNSFIVGIFAAVTVFVDSILTHWHRRRSRLCQLIPRCRLRIVANADPLSPILRASRFDCFRRSGIGATVGDVNRLFSADRAEAVGTPW